MGKFTLRKGLPTKSIFKTQENEWYSPLSLISRVELSADKVKQIESMNLMPDDFIDLIVSENERIGGLRCYGLDVLIQEETLDFFIIDLNDMPSYIGVTGMHDALAKIKPSGSK